MSIHLLATISMSASDINYYYYSDSGLSGFVDSFWHLNWHLAVTWTIFWCPGSGTQLVPITNMLQFFSARGDNSTLTMLGYGVSHGSLLHPAGLFVRPCTQHLPPILSSHSCAHQFLQITPRAAQIMRKQVWLVWQIICQAKSART